MGRWDGWFSIWRQARVETPVFSLVRGDVKIREIGHNSVRKKGLLTMLFRLILRTSLCDSSHSVTAAATKRMHDSEKKTTRDCNASSLEPTNRRSTVHRWLFEVKGGHGQTLPTDPPSTHRGHSAKRRRPCQRPKRRPRVSEGHSEKKFIKDQY